MGLLIISVNCCWLGLILAFRMIGLKIAELLIRYSISSLNSSHCYRWYCLSQSYPKYAVVGVVSKIFVIFRLILKLRMINYCLNIFRINLNLTIFETCCKVFGVFLIDDFDHLVTSLVKLAVPGFNFGWFLAVC